MKTTMSEREDILDEIKSRSDTADAKMNDSKGKIEITQNEIQRKKN